MRSGGRPDWFPPPPSRHELGVRDKLDMLLCEMGYPNQDICEDEEGIYISLPMPMPQNLQGLMSAIEKAKRLIEGNPEATVRLVYADAYGRA